MLCSLLASRCVEHDKLPPHIPQQVITTELNAAAVQLLQLLLGWQERVRLNDPANFKRKRRLVSGMREVGGAPRFFLPFPFLPSCLLAFFPCAEGSAPLACTQLTVFA